MRNRYGIEYSFEAINADTYGIAGNLSYWRYGGLEGQDKIDENNLGFVDPSGGPFLGVGDILPSVNRKITRIFVKDRICFEVE
jgi:hypothetical protein